MRRNKNNKYINNYMDNQNIFQVKYFEGIEKLLNTTKKKFSIIGITDENTEINTRFFIKKWLKSQSNIYKNITYIYFNIDSDDSKDKILKLFNFSEEEFPVIFHVFDIVNIAVKISNATQENIIEANTVMKEHYDKDNNNYLNTIKNYENFDKQLDIKKKEDKLSYLNEYSENFKINYLKDIQNRKELLKN